MQSVTSGKGKTVSKLHVRNLITTLEPALLYRECFTKVISYEYCYRELQAKIKQHGLNTRPCESWRYVHQIRPLTHSKD